jgi:Ca2+-binding EF-hand superfamily protein
MLKLISGTLAAFLLSAPNPDDAQEKHREHPAPQHAFTLSFKALDLNGDGKITREEFMSAFDKLDRNHDGVITPDEMTGHDSQGSQDKQNKQRPGNNKRKR